jgi:hypothetical protein
LWHNPGAIGVLSWGPFILKSIFSGGDGFFNVLDIVVGAEIWNGISGLVPWLLGVWIRQVELLSHELFSFSNTGSNIRDFWINTEVWNNVINIVTKWRFRKWILCNSDG